MQFVTTMMTMMTMMMEMSNAHSK